MHGDYVRFYYSAQIVLLFGAELTRAYADQRCSHQARRVA